MAKHSIYIVEDDPDIADLVQFHAERDGLTVRQSASGRLGLEDIQQDPPDLVVLDLMLPDLDGLEVCRRLQRSDDTQFVPILILSARGEESDIVAGLELGATDYVTKPFSPRVLMARIRSILRRGRDESAPVPDDSQVMRLAGGELTIDLDRHEVRVREISISLTRTEFDMLVFLARRPSFVRTRDQIIAATHGDHAVLTSRTVDVHLTALRRKLGKLGKLIETVRGVGYRFHPVLRGEDE